MMVREPFSTLRAIGAGLLAAAGLLLSACGGGGGGGGGAPITLSGQIRYERVPFDPRAGILGGLDYGATFEAPARAVVVELLRPDRTTVLAATATDEDGFYSFAVPANTDALLRARAQTRRVAATGSWEVNVRDNTAGGALYALDGSVANTGSVAQTRDLVADSGWPDGSGMSYVSTRAAAPFAILDTAYQAVQFVLREGDPAANLPPLDLYWSPDNVAASGDYSVGEIATTSYVSDPAGGTPTGIYVLGDDGVDTDEYDAHVIAHEFYHYLEDRLSRGDSPGGSHSLGDRLDLRLAFSEGYSNAFSAMVLSGSIASPTVYRDSFGAGQGSDFGFDVEDNVYTSFGGIEGWFGEGSMQSIVWDLFDADNDGVDAVALGYAPLYEVFRQQMKDGAALQSIFPLVSGLKSPPGAPVGAIDALVAAQAIRAVDLTPFGDTEVNNGGLAIGALPIYARLTLNGPPVEVCGTAEYGVYNRLGNRRFLRFDVPDRRPIRVRVVGSGSGTPTPDPAITLWRAGFIDSSDVSASTVETLDTTVPGGENYVLEIYEYSHVAGSGSSFDTRGPTCMNATVTG